MKKVVHLSVVHPATDTRIVYRECQHLAARYEVHLIIPESDQLSIPGVAVHSIPKLSLGRRMVQLWPKLWRMIRRIKPQILHFHDPELIPFAWAIGLTGVEIIWDQHEDFRNQVKLRKGKLAEIQYYDWMCHLFTQRFHRVLAESYYVNLPENKGFPSTIVRNFPDVEAIKPLRRFFEVETASPKIWYLGVISAARGIPELISACEILRQTHAELELILHGRCFEQALEGQIRKFDWIRWNDQFNLTRAAKDAAGAWVGVSLLKPLTSTYPLQSFPTKVGEYAALGLPLLVMNYPSQAEFVNVAGVGLNEVSPDSVEDGLRKLLIDSALRERFRSKSIEIVEKSINWATEFERLTELYAKVFNG